jgi:hypothetical protein
MKAKDWSVPARVDFEFIRVTLCFVPPRFLLQIFRPQAVSLCGPLRSSGLSVSSVPSCNSRGLGDKPHAISSDRHYSCGPQGGRTFEEKSL